MSSILRKFGGGASEHPRRQGPGSKTGNHKGWGPPLAFRRPAVHSPSTARRIAFGDNLPLPMRRRGKSLVFPGVIHRRAELQWRIRHYRSSDPILPST